MRFRNGLLAVLAAAAAFPASAVAAPDKTSELSADLPKFAWEGEGTGVPVDALHLIDGDPFECDGPGHDCDYILLDVKHPGVIKIEAAADGAQAQDTPVIGLSYPDIDLYLYKSDKDGNPVGDTLTKSGDEGCATGKAAEMCAVSDITPGFYVVEVDFFLAEAATYKASVELVTPVPPTPPASAAPAEQPASPPPAEPAPGQPQQQQQQQQPPPQPYQAANEPKPKAKKKSSRKATCKKKARKIKNKAKRRKAMKRCARMKR